MSIDQEPKDTATSSDEYIERILEDTFELSESGLSKDYLIENIVRQIQSLNSNKTKVIALTGGAGSGKSTLGHSIIEGLVKAGITADIISTDDYNRGDRAWRREHFEGSEIRDPRDKWDFGLMNQKIEQIQQNKDEDKKVKVPTYNQATGIAIDEGEESYLHGIGPVDVLVVEGDMLAVDNPDLTIYLHVPDDVRLQNRIERDMQHRSEVDQQKVIDNFKLRHHNQHLPYTLPAVNWSDVVIDASPTNDEWQYDIYKRINANQDARVD
jgi:uridine kinase